VGKEALEEGTRNTQSTGSGDGLGDGDIVKDGAAITVGEDSGGLGERGNTSDSGVLVVKLLVEQALLGDANGRQNEGLARVVTVGADTEIDLGGESIGLESLSDTENSLCESKAAALVTKSYRRASDCPLLYT
jgi:hypothetical protein